MRRQGGRPSREALSEEGHLLEVPLDEDSKNINSFRPDSAAHETNVQKVKIEGKTQAGTDPETQAETEGRTTAAAKGETDPKTQAGTEGRTTAAAKGETDLKTQAGTEGRTTAAAKGETDPKTQAGTEGRTKPKTQDRTEGKTKVGTEGKTKPKTERLNGASKIPTNTVDYESDSNRIADIFFSFDLEKKSTKFRLLESLSKHTLNSEIVGLTERLHHGRMCAKLKISDANLKKLLVRLSDEGLISIDRERSKLGRSGWVRYWVRKEAVEYYFKISDRARNSLEGEISSTQANVE